MTMNQAIENCARIAIREGLDLRSKDTMPEYPIPAELAVRTLTVAQYTGHKEE
jgi:2-hydroxychromene-2-carboxylate isomerase